jgi:hypothetical protein
MDRIAAKVQDNPYPSREGMLVDKCARRVIYNLNPKSEEIELIHLTDIQYGNRRCNKQALRNYIAYVLAQDNRFVLFGGDCVDAGTSVSVGSPFDQEGNPESEVLAFVDELAPMAHRILGYVGGNHERRGEQTFGDLGLLISTLLRVPYSPGKQYIDIAFGSWKYFRISLHHGTGAGTTHGGATNMIYRFMMQGDSHLYLVGHLHKGILLNDVREERDNKTLTMRSVQIVGGMSSSFLDHYGTYAEIKGLRVSGSAMIHTIIKKDGTTWETSFRGL